MPTSPTVFLINDNDVFDESLTTLISSVGLSTVRMTSGGTYLREFDSSRSGCVVVDLGKAHLEGMRVLEELSRIPLRPTVVGLIDTVDVTVVVRAARHGVAAVLQMPHTSSTELLDAIQTAISKDAQQRASHARGEEIRGRFDSLSPREWQVLERLLHGDELADIAKKLNVSRRTVENRRARLMRKLGVTTFTALVALMMEKGHLPGST